MESVGATQSPHHAEVRCKRRISFAYSHQPASVARRNARERNRVKQVNNGFATLRAHIPLSVAAALGGPTHRAASPAAGSAASKKLSKVETLRLAVEYIRSLQELLESAGATSPGSTASGHHLHHLQPAPTSPRCSEASDSHSPPPSSYNSDSAISTATTLHNHHQIPAGYRHHHQAPMSPEDEELLDVISWWQQTQ